MLFRCKKRNAVLRNGSYDAWLQHTIARRTEECAAPQVSYDRPHLHIGFDLRILAIADTHNTLREEDLPCDTAEMYDVCFLLGDISSWDLGTIRKTVAGQIPTLSVKGNHDDAIYGDDLIENIHGRVVTVKGVRIAGIEGSIAYKDNSDHRYVMMTDEESVELARAMPPADILISHDAPKYLHGNWNYAHSGLQGVTEYCMRNNVPLNLHGHHHVSTVDTLQNGTLAICCHKVRSIRTTEL